MESKSEVSLVSLGMNLIGALSVFLFGMSTLSKGLKSALGPKLKQIIQISCSHPALAVLTGTVATGALNSATAVSVLVVEFVQSGDMSFEQSLGVCLGICMGSTLTPYLVAFKLTEYALPLAALGKTITAGSPSKAGQHVGSAVFGMGLMFLGMGHMSTSIGPLRSYPPFLDAIVRPPPVLDALLFAHFFLKCPQASLSNPILGLVVSAIATMLLNSRYVRPMPRAPPHPASHFRCVQLCHARHRDCFGTARAVTATRGHRHRAGQ